MNNLRRNVDSDPFCSHRCSNDDADLTLYHVYDNLSQTPLRDDGISCGDPNTYYMHPRHIITHKKILSHLKWEEREPTYFISFYDSAKAALEEAIRRQGQPRPQGMYRNVDSVRIATVSARELDAKKVFYFSTPELKKMVPPSHDMRPRLDPREWFAMEFVPRSTILCNDTPAQFRMRHDKRYQKRH